MFGKCARHFMQFICGSFDWLEIQFLSSNTVRWDRESTQHTYLYLKPLSVKYFECLSKYNRSRDPIGLLLLYIQLCCAVCAWDCVIQCATQSMWYVYPDIHFSPSKYQFPKMKKRRRRTRKRCVCVCAVRTGRSTTRERRLMATTDSYSCNEPLEHLKRRPCFQIPMNKIPFGMVDTKSLVPN